ncbi:unnamed protein product [Cuscuta epithymum]|uniref:Uncharacterized protein n=1 Tax=Cuscuta epithymum TaxID=186058 RepID=A0AAV0CUG7_9ASTE|nr:unnamed protein product [Cuscuta epithymum]
MQDESSCTHLVIHSCVIPYLDLFDSLPQDDHKFLENINKSWDAFMESDTESRAGDLNFHDICEEEKTHLLHGVSMVILHIIPWRPLLSCR